MRLALTLILIAACGSSSPATDAAVKHDAAKLIDGAHAFMDAPPGTTPLTVKNFDTWCVLTVNGGTPSMAGIQNVNVLPGSIALVAKPAAGFTIGPITWHDTAGDTGSGDPGTLAGSGATETSTTSVTVGSTAKCVWACCPDPANDDCSVPEQCP